MQTQKRPFAAFVFGQTFWNCPMALWNVRGLLSHLKSVTHIMLLTSSDFSFQWLLTFVRLWKLLVALKWQITWKIRHDCDHRLMIWINCSNISVSWGLECWPRSLCLYRYGKIVSTKAILDKNTNQCKGKFLFSLFHWVCYLSLGSNMCLCINWNWAKESASCNSVI